MRKVMLITKAILKKLKPPYHYENANPNDVQIHLKLFTPDSSWTWYLYEYNPETRMAFGLCCGHDKELGYVSIEELESVRGLMGLPVERDRYWGPKTLAEVARKEGVNWIIKQAEEKEANAGA